MVWCPFCRSYHVEPKTREHHAALQCRAPRFFPVDLTSLDALRAVTQQLRIHHKLKRKYDPTYKDSSLEQDTRKILVAVHEILGITDAEI